MSGDTVRPPNIANISEIGRHVESSQNQYYISTGHRLYPIFMNHQLVTYDLQPKLNKCAKQLLPIQNLLAVTANQTCRQSRQTASKPILSNSLTYHSQT